MVQVIASNPKNKMTREMKSLADRQAFWKTLFEEKKLTSQLASLATEHVDGITYDDMPQYGQMHVKVESGSTLGDNFQSDTFIVTVRLLQSDTGAETLSTFIKVIIKSLVLTLIKKCYIIKGFTVEFLTSPIGLRIPRSSTGDQHVPQFL